jgi:hypothetical protein
MWRRLLVVIAESHRHPVQKGLKCDLDASLVGSKVGIIKVVPCNMEKSCGGCTWDIPGWKYNGTYGPIAESAIRQTCLKDAYTTGYPKSHHT